MASVVAQVYNALPGNLDQLCERTGIDRKKVRKALDNMQRREQAKSKGDKPDRIWSVKRGGMPPKGCSVPERETNHENKASRTPKERAKLGWARRKKRKRHPGIMLYLETLEARIAALEKIIGV